MAMGIGDLGIPVVSAVEEVREAVAAARRAGKTIGFVPTMGALHRGHTSLIDTAAAQCDYVVVSIFVNPLQFGPTEDLDRYPRTLAQDVALCRQHGAHLVFAPNDRVMYPRPQRTYVNVEKLTEGLCGASRPGHFRGVATVVAKLFNIVLPHRAYFGEKDYQQLVVIRRMVEDLNFPVTVVGVPTVREGDGLALSSRNKYLSPEERQAALSLSRGLQAARRALDSGERDPQVLAGLVRQELAKEPLVREDYISVVDGFSLEPLIYGRGPGPKDAAGDAGEPRGPIVVAVAAHVGQARLIDNLIYREDQPTPAGGSDQKEGG